MTALAQVAALIGALGYLAAAPLELFFFDRPAVRRALRVHAENVDDVRMWAFVVGSAISSPAPGRSSDW